MKSLIFGAVGLLLVIELAHTIVNGQSSRLEQSSDGNRLVGLWKAQRSFAHERESGATWHTDSSFCAWSHR